MAEVKLSAESRAEFGKGAARRLRRAEKVPAVLYGHGSDPVHISLPNHDTQLALRAANALLSISIDGGKDQLALPKQVQRNPVNGRLEHIDLVVVKRGEKVTVEIPLVVHGEDDVDGIVMVDRQTVTIEAEATHIPAHIEVSVAGLEPGAKVEAKDLTLPAGATFVGDHETLILSVAAKKSAEQLEADLAPATEGAAEPAAEAEAEAE